MKKIIVDCDTGIDDFFAILLACVSTELQIEGITTVKGNIDLGYVIKNTCKALEFTQRYDIPIYKGAEVPMTKGQQDASDVHGENGLGEVTFEVSEKEIEKEHAVDYLIRKTKEQPEEIAIVTLGPLTNIAYAIKRDPGFVKRVKSLVVMGGAEKQGNITPYAEFNFYNDPEAAKIVFEAGFKEIIMVGLDVTTKLPLLDKFEDFLQTSTNELQKFLYDITRIGAKYDREVQGHEGYILNDPLLIAYLIDENIIELKDANVDILIQGKTIGKSEISIPDRKKSSNTKVAYDVNAKLFYEILFTRLFPNDTDKIEKIIEKI